MSRNRGNRSSWAMVKADNESNVSSSSSITVAESQNQAIAAKTREQRIHSALNQSLSGGIFIDTRIYLFSRRGSSGSASTPLSVYTSSMTLMDASPEFQTLLSGGFAESLVSDIDAINADYALQRASLAEYGYESDSDLEDDADDDDSDVHASENGQRSDRQTEGDDSNPRCAASTAACLSARPVVVHMQRPGRAVFVKDVAYKTWLALVSYLYTGRIAFARLRSTTAGKEKVNIVQPMPHEPPLCSPKSMYRLADKYGFQDLKKLSLNNIRSQLTADNILPELFSRFTSRYTEVRDLEVKLLSTTFVRTHAIASMSDWMAKLAEGHLPHSAGVMMAFILILVSGQD